MFEVIREGSKWLVDAKTLWGRCVDGEDVGSERQFRIDELDGVRVSPEEYRERIAREQLCDSNVGDDPTTEDTDDTPTEKVEKPFWN